jgi:hypothetical protein
MGRLTSPKPRPGGSCRPLRAREATVAAPRIRVSTLSAELTRRLVFNGKSAAENLPEHFREVRVEGSVGKNPLPGYAPAIESIRKFKPHVLWAVCCVKMC